MNDTDPIYTVKGANDLVNTERNRCRALVFELTHRYKTVLESGFLTPEEAKTMKIVLKDLDLVDTAMHSRAWSTKETP